MLTSKEATITDIIVIVQDVFGYTQFHRVRYYIYSRLILIYFTGPRGNIVLPYISFHTCAIAVYMAENPQTIPS
jgi:hypothetical protein